jgi:hypothetical protein
MKKTKLLILIFLITFLGGFLRFYKLTQNPVSLNIDEVSFGYDAYSVLKTARDQYGIFLPLTFKSTGDYKNPIVIYSMIPSIAIFGLNEFGVRFPTALISTLAIPLFFFLFRKISRNESVALIATLLLAISPWDIYFSRYASDALIASVFVGLGVFAFLKMLEGGKRWAFLSAFLFTLSAYTYHSEKLFLPLFYIVVFLIYRKKLLSLKVSLLTFIVASAVMVLPLLYVTFFGPGMTRASMTFITNDIEFTRNVLLNDSGVKFSAIANIPLLFFFWIRKYLAYFSPSFLFYSGLQMTTIGSYGMGVLYLFEMITLPFGVYSLVKKKIPHGGLVSSWILLGIIPASLTNNEQHAGRTIFILPAIIILSAWGFLEFIKLIRKISIKYVRYSVIAAFLILVIWDFAHALLTFGAYFPQERDEDFMNGTKEAVEYILQNQDKYQEVVFDPTRGIIAPYIVSVPHLYILFYSQYDPHTYQTETKRIGDNFYGFGKYTIRNINWPVDKKMKDTLFVGSPWSLNEKDVGSVNILKKIYLEDGRLALVVAKSDN